MTTSESIADGSSRPGLWLLGPVVLLAAAVAWGALGTHGSTDTWIALATGRYMLTHGEITTTDPFSYTFNGKPFFNQNWLSHLILYWTYDRFGPAAVVVFTFLMNAVIFLLVLQATGLRTRSWLAGLLATGVVAAASRNYLDVRPVTIGYFCLAVTCAVLHYYSTTASRHRNWPAWLLLPVLLLWGNAHGSFVFGYGLVVLFGLCWWLGRWLGRLAIPTARVHVVDAWRAAVVAAILTILLSPFGLSNFSHSFVVGGSRVFRDVKEWYPPWVPLPGGVPVWPFWVALTIAGVSVIAAVVMGRLAATQTPAEEPSVRKAPTVTWFDVALLAVGLGMALFARRFAPLFFVLATAPVATVILRAAHAVPARARRIWGYGLSLVTWPAAGLLWFAVVSTARAELVTRFADQPQFNLLERFVCYDESPLDAIDLLRQSNTSANVFSEWVDAGAILFALPRAKVFIDGRSQQVYSEQHYLRYLSLFPPFPFDPKTAFRTLEDAKTDAVLLWVSEKTAPLAYALQSSASWVLTLLTPESVLFLRRESDPLGALARLEREGRVKWPDYPESLATRALLWMETEPVDNERALRMLQAAVAADVRVGRIAYPAVATALRRLGRAAGAVTYFEDEERRVGSPDNKLVPLERQAMLQILHACKRSVED